MNDPDDVIMELEARLLELNYQLSDCSDYNNELMVEIKAKDEQIALLQSELAYLMKVGSDD